MYASDALAIGRQLCDLELVRELERGDSDRDVDSNERGDTRDEASWNVYVRLASCQWTNFGIVRAKSHITPNMNSCLALPFDLVASNAKFAILWNCKESGIAN